MSEMQKPDSLDAITSIVAESTVVVPVGNRTKPALSHAGDSNAIHVSTSKYRGIVEYEPSEFTFTAKAGTTLREVIDVLRDKGQYLPFDPMLVEGGATLAGTVCAGLSGPGRFRYGGLRDFLLGAHLLTSDGNLVRVGGKVVKNAAGFDIPKLLVGSIGRYGLIVDLTFKVFPVAPAYRSFKIRCDSAKTAASMMQQIGRGRWEPDAVDFRNEEVMVRFSGPHESIAPIAADVEQQLGLTLSPVADDEAAAYWNEVIELSFAATDPFVVKIPSSPASFPQLVDKLDSLGDVQTHVSVGGAVVWAATSTESALQNLDPLLAAEGLQGLVVRGDTHVHWLGKRNESVIAKGIKSAIDPQAKFLPI